MIIIIIINEIDAVIKIWSLQVEGERGREEREIWERERERERERDALPKMEEKSSEGGNKVIGLQVSQSAPAALHLSKGCTKPREISS